VRRVEGFVRISLGFECLTEIKGREREESRRVFRKKEREESFGVPRSQVFKNNWK